MQIEKIKAAAEIAKARTSDKRWLNAIDKAVAESASWITTEHVGFILITSNSGETYRVNGHCNCKAGVLGQACKHLAYRRLTEIAATIEETASAAVSFAADVEASSRQALILEITNIWPRFAPGVELDRELLARFKVNRLDMLDDGCLRDIRVAIAM